MKILDSKIELGKRFRVKKIFSESYNYTSFVIELFEIKYGFFTYENPNK